ncbi:MAG: substrate-binding domain-containing protein [Alphaproteobacteria bacterium]|nr:substrate-binding domain-containing protein [Alphaproteobacteria bacterium]
MFRSVMAVAMTLCTVALAGDRHIIVQSTTSTQNSGLYDHILPIYEAAAGVQVRVVAVGTGQAIKNARNCDGDVLLVHAKSAEEAFVGQGYGKQRFDVMYNDFVIVGPRDDPAGIRGLSEATEALKAIASLSLPFASRADDSGTHQKEMQLWRDGGVDPIADSGTWYRETGSGMGATLNIAVAMNAYAMTDRATWISFGNKAEHSVLVEGDPDLFNQYGVILVSSEKCPNTRAEAGQHFINWLLGPDGQEAIAAYSLDGMQLFFPNARPNDPS